MATYTTSVTTGVTEVSNAVIDRWMYGRTLQVAKKRAVLYNAGKLVKVPAGESKTVSFTRFERLALPLTPLTEGTTPTATPLSTSRVTCVLEQWGAYTSITDVAEKIARFGLYARASDLLGEQAAEVVDREVLRVLLGGTQVFFPGTVTSRAGITANDVPSTGLMQKVYATLGNYGAPMISGKLMGVCDHFNGADIRMDAVFINTATYNNLAVLKNNEIGEWAGIRWMVSNTLPVLVLQATTNATVSTDATAGSETTLADGVYTTQIVANDANGFPVKFYATQTFTIATSADVGTILTPTLPTGYTSFDIYVSTVDGGAATLARQAERIAGGLTKRIIGGGSSATGIVLDSTGQRGFVAPATGVNVHYMFVFGDEYYAVTELEGIRMVKTPKGPDKSDPLDQQTPIGWKAFFKACILNHNFGGRIECASAFN